MTDHIVDPNKKVLSSEQIRALAEIDGWRWGEYRFDGKWTGRRVPCSPRELASKRVRLADMSLPIDTDEDGDYPNFNDLNILIGMLEWLRTRSPRIYFKWIMLSSDEGVGVKLRERELDLMGEPIKDEKYVEVFNPDIRVAIAEALTQMKSKS